MTYKLSPFFAVSIALFASLAQAGDWTIPPGWKKDAKLKMDNMCDRDETSRSAGPLGEYSHQDELCIIREMARRKEFNAKYAYTHSNPDLCNRLRAAQYEFGQSNRKKILAEGVNVSGLVTIPVFPNCFNILPDLSTVRIYRESASLKSFLYSLPRIIDPRASTVQAKAASDSVGYYDPEKSICISAQSCQSAVAK